MKTGDHVAIHSGRAFTEDAIIEAYVAVDELPAIEGAPNIETVRAVIAEGGVAAVALISYKFLDQPVCFAAFEDHRGNWSDLKGHQLIIEPRAASNELDTLLKNQQTRREDKPRIVSRRGAAIDWRKF